MAELGAATLPDGADFAVRDFKIVKYQDKTACLILTVFLSF
jgi:hypothetical protein